RSLRDDSSAPEWRNGRRRGLKRRRAGFAKFRGNPTPAERFTSFRECRLRRLEASKWPSNRRETAQKTAHLNVRDRFEISESGQRLRPLRTILLKCLAQSRTAVSVGFHFSFCSVESSVLPRFSGPLFQDSGGTARPREAPKEVCWSIPPTLRCSTRRRQLASSRVSIAGRHGLSCTRGASLDSLWIAATIAICSFPPARRRR